MGREKEKVGEEDREGRRKGEWKDKIFLVSIQNITLFG